MPTYSNDFIVNVNKFNSDDPLLVLLEITHPFISDTIRLVNDNKDLVSNSHNYLAMPFKIDRQSDVQNELPKITLTVQNVGRSLIKWIDSSGGGRDAVIKLLLVRRSTPNLIEESLDLGIASVNVSTRAVIFNLNIQNNLSKRSCRLIYDVERAYGLF